MDCVCFQHDDRGFDVLTFGGPGDSTEILSLHIYKTAFVGQQLGVAAAISAYCQNGLALFGTVIFSVYMSCADIDHFLLNSLFVGLISTVVTLVLGCMAAYGLARFRFKARSTIAYTTLLLRTVPLAVMAIPVFLIWSQWQLVNSLWGLILLYVAVNLPFTIWLPYGFVLHQNPASSRLVVHYRHGR
jgi:ABC-type glycerol-3-phosphate transport system permease component